MNALHSIASEHTASVSDRILECAGTEQVVALLILADLANEMATLDPTSWREVHINVIESTPLVLQGVMPLISTDNVDRQTVLSMRCVRAWLGLKSPSSTSTFTGLGALLCML
jgi:hypothetical protein